MNYDEYGRTYTSSEELCELLYKNPNLDLSLFQVQDPEKFNNSCCELHADLPKLTGYVEHTESVDCFDIQCQSEWLMPKEYKELDIAKWVLDQCQHQEELQRVGEELLLFQERELFDLLRYLKYLVDTFRKNKIVWGVGRGSSVASYVLYLIGVHKIDSLYYQLDITEFLK
jgi:DNA polymerase III alpha subunit